MSSSPFRVAHLLPAIFAASACAHGSPGAGSDAGTADLPPPIPCAGEPSDRLFNSADAQISIDTAANLGPAKHLIGFVHGISAPSGSDYDFAPATAAKITALGPTFWKVSDSRHYLKAKSFGTKVMYASSDTYFNYNPVPYPWNDSGLQSGTFDNWKNFDLNEVAVLQASLTPSRPVDYWGILNEPQFVKYSTTDQGRLMQTFAHGYHDFKDSHPEQKVVAPTTIGFNAALMQQFLDGAVSSGLVFDAIDWHELGSRPEDVVPHADSLRSLLKTRPSLGMPPILIDEYGSPEEHLIPGFAAAWFYYLEAAGVMHAARACWDTTDSINGKWSNCWDGLNGLFMKDNVTPQALYWVFERYSQMTGTNLSSVSSAASDVVALARSTPIPGATAPEIRVLAGRFVSNILSTPAAPKNVAIQIRGLPDGTCPIVTIERIPYQGPAQTSLAVAQSLAAPQLIANYSMALTGGSLTVHLPQFADRDAYYIRISPP